MRTLMRKASFHRNHRIAQNQRRGLGKRIPFISHMLRPKGGGKMASCGKSPNAVVGSIQRILFRIEKNIFVFDKIKVQNVVKGKCRE